MPGNFFQSFIFLSKPHAWLIHIEEDAASEKIKIKRPNRSIHWLCEVQTYSYIIETCYRVIRVKHLLNSPTLLCLLVGNQVMINAARKTMSKNFHPGSLI